MPSKNIGIYAVFTILQDVVSIFEKDNDTVFYDVFALQAQQNIVQKWPKKGQESTSKSIL